MELSGAGLRQVEENFFKIVLHGESEVHIPLRDFGMWFARIAKYFFHTVGEMWRQLHRPVILNLHSLITAQRFEIVEVELERSVLQVNNF